MRTNPFQGLGVAVVTPFTPEGDVDFYALRELIHRLIEGGVDYLCVLGTTAETPTLSTDEKERIVEVFVDTVAGRVPLLLGCGGNNTDVVCAFLENTDFEGIDGVLVVTPYYNKPTQEGLYRHYAAVSKSSPVPVVLYNVPGRTGVNMLPETTLRIARDFDNVVAIKEASGMLMQIDDIISEAPEGFEVISGDDSLTLSLMNLGAVGVISVVGNAFPTAMSELVHLLQKGHREEALAIHRELRPICRLAFAEGNPSGIKCMMALREELANVVRLPLLEVSPATESKIVAALDKFAL
ncbi:MAG: 4-hydroxy-tetrahydrodipicolinate synthase [Bacteroidales bacterium]|nr:4-hydroxy-tetrahydrodipicolinate synthase [Bacteroidales bacterium]